jgi:hypothetical protein
VILESGNADVPKQLRQAIRTRGMHAAANGEWSTGAALGHLWRCEVDVWQYRLAQMQREENPFWEYWDPAQYAWEAEFGATDILSLLDAFEFRRSQTCKYLRALTDEGWARRTSRLWQSGRGGLDARSIETRPRASCYTERRASVECCLS